MLVAKYKVNGPWGGAPHRKGAAPIGNLTSARSNTIECASNTFINEKHKFVFASPSAMQDGPDFSETNSLTQ